MSLAKTAQHLPQEGQVILVLEEDEDFDPVIPLTFDHDHNHEDEDKKEKDDEKHDHKDEVLVKIDEDDDDETSGDGFAFLLPLVPGGVSQDDIEDDNNDLAVEDEEEEIKVEEVDPWDWESPGLAKFTPWLNDKLKSVPGHSGLDTVGLERAIAYLDSLDRIISKAVRKDIKNELDIGKIEQAREEIRKGVSRLEDRLDKVNSNRYKRKKKSKSDDESTEGLLVKEAQKIAGVGGIVVTIPLLISHCARICINSTVSHGRDIEDTFNKLASKYKLSLREKAELRRTISDMGYYVRDVEGDFDKDFDPTSEDNLNFSPNYPA